MRRRSFFIVDTVLIAAATVSALILSKAGAFEGFDELDVGIYFLASIVFGGVSLLVSGTSNRVWRYFSALDILPVFVVAFLTVLLTGFAVILLDVADVVPLSLIFSHSAAILIVLVSARLVMRVVLEPIDIGRRSHVVDPLARHSLIIGANEIAEFYIRCVDRQAIRNVVVEGILDADGTAKNDMIRSINVLNTPENAGQAIADLSVHGIIIDSIVLAVPFDRLTMKARRTLRELDRSDVRIDAFAERLDITSDLSTSQKKSPKGKFYDNETAPGASYLKAKRGFDIIAAACLIAVLFPVLALIWILILADIGRPVYFWQIRPGLQGRPFKLIKFRTMRSGYKRRNENRISKVGAVLRRYRLDELLQLFNILKGDMSFIGPRPLLPADQPADATARLSMRPGLTGWAQVNGGRSLSREDKAALDAWYVGNASSQLDMKIVLLTISVVFSGERPVETRVLELARNRGKELTAPDPTTSV